MGFFLENSASLFVICLGLAVLFMFLDSMED